MAPRRISRTRYGDPGCRPGNYAQYLETLPGGKQHIIIKNCSLPQFDNTQLFTVPPDHYFMMGDNRDDSADSRDPTSGVGYVPVENLVGRAEFIFYSTDGYAAWWEPWKWPFTVRYDRLLTAIGPTSVSSAMPDSLHPVTIDFHTGYPPVASCSPDPVTVYVPVSFTPPEAPPGCTVVGASGVPGAKPEPTLLDRAGKWLQGITHH